MELRFATRDDIAELQRIRGAVRENRLVSTVIGVDDYVRYQAGTARTWVALLDGRIAGFASGDRATGNIWALFVDPIYEGLGVGRALHDAMITWLHEVTPMLWLTTERGTRAEHFYRAAGWRETAELGVELRFELART